MHICVYVCIYVYMYVFLIFVYVYMYVYVHIYIRICICIYVYIHIRIYTWIHMYLLIYIYLYTYIHEYVHVPWYLRSSLELPRCSEGKLSFLKIAWLIKFIDVGRSPTSTCVHVYVFMCVCVFVCVCMCTCACVCREFYKRWPLPSFHLHRKGSLWTTPFPVPIRDKMRSSTQRLDCIVYLWLQCDGKGAKLHRSSSLITATESDASRHRWCRSDPACVRQSGTSPVHCRKPPYQMEGHLFDTANIF